MNYLNIVDCSVADGEGLRVALFVSGCSHKCKGCHNPESWNYEIGKPFTDDTKKILFNLLDRDYIDGLTLTGGDPLFEHNLNTITNLVMEVKDRFPNKTIWLYTGYQFEDIKRLKLLKYVDVVVDGPFIQDLRDVSLPFRGSTNQKIIRLKELR